MGLIRFATLDTLEVVREGNILASPDDDDNDEPRTKGALQGAGEDPHPFLRYSNAVAAGCLWMALPLPALFEAAGLKTG